MISPCTMALIFTPTRELASQISSVIHTVITATNQTILQHNNNHNHHPNDTKYLIPGPGTVVTIIGGLNEDKQRRLLRENRVCIVIATPGRFAELYQETHAQYRVHPLPFTLTTTADTSTTDNNHNDNSSNNNNSIKKENPWFLPLFFNLSSIRYLVIDEIDRMMQDHHYEELSVILSAMTIHETLAKKYGTNHVHILIGKELQGDIAFNEYYDIIDNHSDNNHFHNNDDNNSDNYDVDDDDNNHHNIDNNDNNLEALLAVNYEDVMKQLQLQEQDNNHHNDDDNDNSHHNNNHNQQHKKHKKSKKINKEKQLLNSSKLLSLLSSNNSANNNDDSNNNSIITNTLPAQTRQLLLFTATALQSTPTGNNNHNNNNKSRDKQYRLSHKRVIGWEGSVSPGISLMNALPPGIKQ
jgi:hypothetical protein